MRPKTVRRLAILGVCLLGLGVALTASVILLKQRNERRLVALREQGLAAFRQGDLGNALLPLSTYLSKPNHQGDAEALLAFGKSRQAIEMPDGRHIAEAIQIFRRYLEVRPADAEVQRILLGLYPKAGYNAEAISLADAVLGAHPQDIDALKCKAAALINGRRFEEALSVCEKWNQAAPLDLDGQAVTYSVLWQLHRPYKELIERAEAAKAQHPGDARFELLEAYAYRYAAGQDAQLAKAMREKALACLRKAAQAAPLPDAVFVRQLARLFDDLGRFDEAEEVLIRATGQKEGDAQILQLLVQRLWQKARYGDIVDRLRTLDASARDADRHLLAMRAASLYELNRPEEAAPIAEALAARRGDEAAQAWASALRTHYQQAGPVDARTAVSRYRNALLRDSSNLVIRFWLGQAYAQLGETELALQAWRAVSAQNPSWAAPHAAIARVLVARGESQAAIQEAQVAYRQHSSAASAIALALAVYPALDKADAGGAAELLKLVGPIQAQVPGESETLPIYVTLLGRTGQRDTAVAVIRKTLEAKPPASLETLLHLAASSREQNLGLEQDILEHAQKVHGLTPALALFRAGLLAAAGKAQDGLALLQSAAGAQSATPAAAQWQLAIAEYLESIRDPGAPQAWVALGDQNAGDLPAQLAILKAPSAWADRAFVQRTIDRVVAISGEESLVWRLARARWLLGSEARERDSAEAVVTLRDIVRGSPGLVEPRRLYAAALQNVGDAAGAIEQLKAVVELSPADAPALTALARLLHDEGRLGEAEPYLDRLAALPSVEPALRRTLAELYARQGQFDRAGEILTALPAAEQDVATQSLQAEVLCRQGQVEQARGLYVKLLERPEPGVALLRAAANFFASQGDRAQARQVLARLAQAKANPAAAELVLAEFHERWDDRATAAGHYSAAAGAAPQDPQVWRRLIAFDVRGGDYEAAQTAAEQAAKALPGDTQVAGLRRQVSAMGARPASERGPLQVLHEAVVSESGDTAADEALRLLDEARQSGQTADVTLVKLRQLGDRYPRSLALQETLVDRYLAAEQASEAAAIAARAMEAFPTAAEPARLAVLVYSRLAGRSSEMLLAAQKWRQRSMEQPLGADLAIVEAQVRLRNAEAALRQLAPYLEAAKREPDQYRAVIAAYVRVLAMAGRTDEAAQLLKPLLPQSAGWRELWMATASSGLMAPAQGGEWLQEVAAQISPDAAAEHLALCRSWYNLGRQRRDAKAVQKARELLAPYAAKEGGWDAQMLLAAVSEALGDLPAAETAYRRLLQARPNESALENNLAMALLRQGGAQRLAEARGLADRAVAAARKGDGGGGHLLGMYLDTRGRIVLEEGQLSAAIADLEEAGKLAPDAAETLIALADALVRNHQPQQARSMVDRIDTLLPDASTLPDAAQRQLASVRDAVRNAATSPAER